MAKDKRTEIEFENDKTSVVETASGAESPTEIVKQFEDLPAEVKEDVVEMLEPSTVLAINTSTTTHTLEDGKTFAPRTKLEISQKDFTRLSPHGIRAV